MTKMEVTGELFKGAIVEAYLGRDDKVWVEVSGYKYELVGKDMFGLQYRNGEWAAETQYGILETREIH